MLLNGGLLYRISYSDVGIQYTRLRNWLPPANNKVMSRGQKRSWRVSLIEATSTVFLLGQEGQTPELRKS